MGRVAFLGAGDLEDAAEGRDLLARDAAVGLGDLRAQRDHADGEGDRAFRRHGRARAPHQRGQPITDTLPEPAGRGQVRRRVGGKREVVHDPDPSEREGHGKGRQKY